MQHPLRATAAHMLTPPVGFCGFFEDIQALRKRPRGALRGPAPVSCRGFWERGSLPGSELASMVSSASGERFVQDSPTLGTQALHMQPPLSCLCSQDAHSLEAALGWHLTSEVWALAEAGPETQVRPGLGFGVGCGWSGAGRVRECQLRTPWGQGSRERPRLPGLQAGLGLAVPWSAVIAECSRAQHTGLVCQAPEKALGQNLSVCKRQSTRDTSGKWGEGQDAPALPLPSTLVATVPPGDWLLRPSFPPLLEQRGAETWTLRGWVPGGQGVGTGLKEKLDPSLLLPDPGVSGDLERF